MKRNHLGTATARTALLIVLVTLVSLWGGGTVHGDPTPGIGGPEIRIDDWGTKIPAWLARWELARAYSHLKRYDEAIAQYERLLKEKPQLEEARTELATVLFWRGRNAEALAALEEIPPARLPDRGKVLLGDLYGAVKRYDRAEALYRDYLKAHPADQKVRLRLAELLSWMKRYGESLREYESLLKERPQDTQLRRKYALVLMWASRFEEAARELKKTLPDER